MVEIEVKRKDRVWYVCEQGLRTFKPPPKITVSQWSDRFRMLSPESSAEPGRWYTERAEYQRGIMDAFNDPDIEMVVVMSSAQIGKTEILNNVVGYHIDQDPCPMLIVQPTLEIAKAWSKDRFSPMFRDTECLKGKVKTVRVKGESTLLHKVFYGGHITMSGAKSPASLRARPIRIVLCDDIDTYEATTEGDPVDLAKKRTTTFWNRKIGLFSSPTIKDMSRIELAYEMSDKRKFHIPCPYCGKYQFLKWEKDSIVWKENDPYSAVYKCENCEGDIMDADKLRLLRLGRWIPEKETKGIAGFWINELYSPWVSFGNMASRFLEAKKDRETLKVFINTSLGETWVEKVESKSVTEIMISKIDLPPLVCPEGTIALTCGVDQGQGGFWFVVLAWKRDFSVHLVHYGFMIEWNNIKTLAWENIYKVEGDQEEYLSIWRTGIDTGGSKYEQEDVTMTEAAYSFLRQYGMGRIYGTKGGASYMSAGRKMRLSIIDKMPKGEIIPGGIALWILDTSSFKDAVHYRLGLKENEPGRLTFHNETGTDIISHILAEEKRRNKQGKYEWVKIRKHNHYLDCLVMAFSMADPECWGGIAVYNPPRREPDTEEKEKKSWITGDRKKSKWLR